MKSFIRMAVVCAALFTVINVHAQPGCNISIPYTTGFETDVSNQAPNCWTTLLGEAYAFNFYLYAHGGSQILALNYSTGEARIATPRIPLPLNQVGVNLWYVDLAWSPGLMKVGFVTSLSGTVQWIDTIATCYDYTYVQLDFTDQNIADTGYLVFSYDNTSGAGTGLIDDLTILQFSSCSPVDNLHVAEFSNTEATVAWSESGSDALGYWCYIADTDSRAATFDSVYLPAGSDSYTFSSLQGDRQYYVWVVSFCSSEPGMTSTCSFVTYPDCGAVQNLRSRCGYRQMALDWDAPAGGEEATEYLVSYRPASDTHWTTAVATEDCFFLTDLEPDTRYFYRVSSVCSDSVSLAVEGSAYTLGCSATVIPPTGVHNNLPVAYGSYNSYTQQIYLSTEMTGIDTIVGLTFFLSDNYIIDTAPVVVYLANTSKSRFNSGYDYVPASALTEVFDGVVFNNGREVSIHFTTPFLREADSNLVVAINKSMDDYGTVVPSFVVGSATLRSMYSTGIGSISPSSPSYGTRLNYVNTIRFGTRGCELPACESPMVCIASVGDDYVDVVWNADTATTYSCAYRLSGADAWTVADSAVTTNRFRFPNLEVGRDYEFMVSRLCNADTLSDSVTVSLPCLPVGVPYGETFEGYIANTVFARSCWYSGTLSVSHFVNYPTVTTLSGSSNKVCRLNDSYIVLPKFSVPLNQLQVRFNLRQTSQFDVLVLGLLDNLDDTVALATVIDTFAFVTSSAVFDTTVLYMLNELDATEGHLLIMAQPGGADQYIDNISVEVIPDCVPVEQCVVSGVTTTYATVSWTEVSGGITSPSGYVLEYGPRFFEPGNGISQTVYSTPYLLTGLEHSSDYDLYVYTLCDGDTSIPYGPIRFSTMCNTVSELPYLMTFEGIQDQDFTDQSLPTCWYGEALASNAIVPAISYSADTSLSPSGHYNLHFRGPGIVALPLFGEGINDLKVQFHLYSDYPHSSTIVVGTVDSVAPGFGSSFSPIDTLAYAFGENERDVTFYFSDYTGTASRIALRTIGVTYANFYLDNLEVGNVTECIPPQHITASARTATTATLEWRVSQAPRYRVEYGPAGFTPGTGLCDTTYTTSITLGGLLPATSYDVWVTGLCGTSVSSSTSYRFSTLRGLPVATFPYLNTFADSTENNAWELENGEQTNRWSFGTAEHSTGDDISALYISTDSGATHSYDRNQITHSYAYRPFRMTHTSYRIQYDWYAEGETGYDFLRVFLVPASVTFTPGTNPSGTQFTTTFRTATPEGWIALDGGQALARSTTWQTYQADFEIPQAGDYNLLFYWLNDGSGGTQPPAVVDNLSVELTGCPKVERLRYTDSTSNSITIRWDAQPLAQKYLVEYGLANFTLGTGQVDTALSNIYTIAGLEPNTSYDIYVTTQCDEGWYSDTVSVLYRVWTAPIPTHTVTLLVNNEAYGTVLGGGTYEHGSTAVLSATPATSCRFMAWDDGNTDNPRDYVVTSDVTLTALFETDSVGIRHADESLAGLVIYPNPASGTVTLCASQPSNVTVVDRMGRVVLQHKCTTTVTTLDISGLTPGVYFVRMDSQPTAAAHKLVVK